jgi:hypothetical protein
MIISVLLLLVATAFAVGVIEAIVESTQQLTDPMQIAVFDKVLLEPGLSTGIWILCGLSAVAALAMVSAAARIRGRRLERRLAAELDARYEEMSSKSAGDAGRAHLLEARVAELQTWVERANEERDEARAALVEAEKERDAAERRLREAAAAPSMVVVPDPQEETVGEASSG